MSRKTELPTTMAAPYKGNNQISVELIDKMGSDLTTVNAARVSMGAHSEKLSDRDFGLIDFLAKHEHITPFRHAQVTLRCRGPIFLARQLGKHQVGFSWNEISRRYKDGEAIEIECYEPEVAFRRPGKLMTQSPTIFGMEVEGMVRGCINSANKMAVDNYNQLIDMGVAPEQARMVLPQSMITEWIWTGSLYGFAAMYKQRTTAHAQYEARLFAEKVSKIMFEHFPVCWEALTK